MSFQKNGTAFKISNVKQLENIESWNEFKKQAKCLQVSETQKEAVDKEADFQVVASIDPEKFIYIHSTIMAGVATEDNGFWITSATEKYINDNNDSWETKELLGDYKTFKRATTFVEHDQRLENAKGKCIDVIARDMGDTVLIDVLFSVDRRHKDLVANIENGIINAVSMGCSTAKTICSICGNVATSPEQYCDHVKMGNKGRMYRCDDGKTRKSAEICKENTFFDVSLVANPAFAGAIFRKILSSSEISNHLLANILNSKIEAFNLDNGETLLKAASKETDIANIALKPDGKIEIRSGNQFYVTGSLSQEEIQNIKSFVIQADGTSKEEKSASITLSKIIEKLFGKKQATHPILNESGKKDFGISREDYSDVTIKDRHNVKQYANIGISLNTPCSELNITNPIEIKVIELPVELDISPLANKNSIIKISRVPKFECHKCGFTEDLWKVKSASIDTGNNETFECPRCFFIAEKTLYEKPETNTVYRGKVRESTLETIEKLSKKLFKKDDEVKIIGGKNKGSTGKVLTYRGPLVIVELKNKKSVWKNQEELQKIETKKANFIANQNIPVEIDEDQTIWFDQQGNSVVSKGEKFAFITTVENGEYGLFTTSKGEDFFMPMKYISTGVLKS